MKYIFFDIDGTIRTRDDYTIPDSTILAIQKLKEAGHRLFIATGRGLYSARNMGRLIGIDNVISDGGRIVYEDGKIIYHHPMSTNEVAMITSLAAELHAPIGYSNEFAIHSTSDIFSKSFDLDQTILCSVKQEINPVSLGGIDKIYIWSDKEALESRNSFHEIEHHWLRERLCVIEHRHKDEGILFLMEKYGLNINDCICFGDDINDITMFDLCGFSVCMGNGHETAKQHATYIANDIHDDGIYKTCLTQGWIK